MKMLSILGSTGSIGTNALKIVEQFPDRFSVKALTAKRNMEKLAQQIRKYHPEMVAVYDEDAAASLESKLKHHKDVKILIGEAGYTAAATYESTEMVLTAVVGAAGLMPTIAAVEAGKDVALANKETLVMAGEIVMNLAEKNGVRIIPVDSEHSAIFQCMMGQQRSALSHLIITASGGPFLERPGHTFYQITPKEALNHPNWKMGPKITVDSATLMNKGLEVIEAKHLFQIDTDSIRVVVHPQSIIHSMVSFHDGSVIAQLGIPDMKGAIAFALSFPERLPLAQPLPDFIDIGAFTFKEPDLTKFKCLNLAITAGKGGGTLPSVLNAANEVAVHAFLERRLSFDMIPDVIHRAIRGHTNRLNPSLSDILDSDAWARAFVADVIESDD